MEKTFTPGPWAVCTEPANDLWYGGLTVYSEPSGKRVGDASSMNAEWKANARLIAAAPKMLAALESALADCSLSNQVIEIVEDAINAAKS